MPSKRSPKSITPNSPLSPQREAFALAIVNGHKLGEAHRLAGFTGKSKAAAWQLRHAPDVTARIKWMLESRVKADAKRFARRKIVRGDLLDESIKRLAEMAFTDIRELVAWCDEPVMNEAGEVTGTRQRLVLRDSAEVSPAAATLLRGAFRKGGDLRLEFHDQRLALESLAKLLKGSDAVPAASNVTVNQVNVGSMSAIDAAQRVAFMLAAAGRSLAAAPAPAPPTIEGKAESEPESR